MQIANGIEVSGCCSAVACDSQNCGILLNELDSTSVNESCGLESDLGVGQRMLGKALRKMEDD